MSDNDAVVQHARRRSVRLANVLTVAGFYVSGVATGLQLATPHYAVTAALMFAGMAASLIGALWERKLMGLEP